jgi:hypothetical protein
VHIPACLRQALLPLLLKEGTVALLGSEALEGDMPAAVNAYVLEVIEYCVATFESDCVPQAELLAECLDYKHLLYREHGSGSGVGDDADQDGDTVAWRHSLDFADRVDAIKVNWDNVKLWNTAQIVETNPARQMVKLHFDTGYEGDDRWVSKFSDELAPYKTASLRVVAKIKQWKESLLPGQWVDAQDHTFKNWFNAQVSARVDAAEYAVLEPRQYWQQHDNSDHVKVVIIQNDRQEESGWISVDSHRLARYGTKAGGAEAHFDDLDDANDPDDPSVFACDHGKSYGCPSLVAAVSDPPSALPVTCAVQRVCRCYMGCVVDQVNCFGRAGGFDAILRRLLAAG